MKKLFFYALMASFFTFAACQSDRNNQNTEEGETTGTGINDEVGGTEDGVNSDAQGEETIGGEGVGTETDNTDVEDLDNDTDMENDTTEMQPQDQYQ